MDAKKWFSETAHRRITDGDIANILGVTRKTANKRVNDGLPMADLVTISRHFDINPVTTLVELGHLNYKEVEDFLDSDGQLVATATPGQLSLELARQLNPATAAPELDELSARREAKSNNKGEETTPAVEPIVYDPLTDVAYDGPDEDALRKEIEGDWTDPDYPIP